MNKISKGKAFALFIVVAIIALIVMFGFIIYGNPYTDTSFYIGVLLMGIIMILNVAWLVVWKLKYDKNKLIEQQENLSNNVSIEVESENLEIK